MKAELICISFLIKNVDKIKKHYKLEVWTYIYMCKISNFDSTPEILWIFMKLLPELHEFNASYEKVLYVNMYECLFQSVRASWYTCMRCMRCMR